MKASKWDTQRTTTTAARAYLTVRNDLLLAGEATGQQAFLQMVEQKRQQVISEFPTIKSYIAYMAGCLAGTPIAHCQLYEHGMKPAREPGGWMPSTKLIRALGDCDIDTLPLMVEIKTAGKTIHIPL